MRRHYLPHEEDDLDNLARALWLDKYHAQRLAHAVAQGIAKAFNG
ncbi:DUF6890 family protein [Aeromonas molluscorum]